MLPAGVQRGLEVVVTALLVVTLVILFWHGLDVAREEGIMRTPALRIQYFWVFLAVPIGAVLMLVQSNSDAPLAYGIYVLMQTPAGRGAGAALGVIAVVIVAICMGLSQLAVRRSQRAHGLDL